MYSILGIIHGGGGEVPTTFVMERILVFVSCGVIVFFRQKNTRVVALQITQAQYVGHTMRSFRLDYEYENECKYDFRVQNSDVSRALVPASGP